MKQESWDTFFYDSIRGHCNIKDANPQIICDDDFSAYDRIVYYNHDDTKKTSGLIIFSKKHQLLKLLKISTGHLHNISLQKNILYNDIEYLNNYLFLVDSNKKIIYICILHQNLMCSVKHTIELLDCPDMKKNSKLTVWQTGNSRSYNFLFGPLTDNRYVYFNTQDLSKTKYKIHNPYYIHLISNDSAEYSQVDFTYDQFTNSLFCIKKPEKNFFEYDEFNGNGCNDVNVISNLKIQELDDNDYCKIYTYRPHHYFKGAIYNRIASYISSSCIYDGNLSDAINRRYRMFIICNPKKSLTFLGPTIFNNKNSRQEELIYTCNSDFYSDKILSPIDVCIDNQEGGLFLLCTNNIMKIHKSTVTSYGSEAIKKDISIGDLTSDS